MANNRQPVPEGANISFTALDGPNQGKRYEVESAPAILGSGATADIILPGLGVAETHARLAFADKGVIIEDLATGRETRVNARTVKRARIQNGDIIELGEIRLLFHLRLPAERVSRRAAERKEDVARRNAIWTVGFSPEFHDWFKNELAPKLKIESKTFRTGEEVLTALSKALEDGKSPSLLILDLRIPIMNGINVAIAVRAYERGFNLSEKIPIVFLFNPPEQASFEKVIRFCQPLRVVLPGEGEEEKKIAVRKVIKGSRS